MVPPALGIDIVDLDAEREVPLHPRYYSRVLAPEERACVRSESELWPYWAAKEAAFKALSALGIAKIFSPHQFVVSPQHDVVRYGARQLSLRLEQQARYVLAVCASSAEMLAQVKVWVGPAGESQQHSQQVRALARDQLAKELQQPPEQVDFNALPGLISFSHHGSFVACAWWRSPDGAGPSI